MKQLIVNILTESTRNATKLCIEADQICDKNIFMIIRNIFMLKKSDQIVCIQFDICAPCYSVTHMGFEFYLSSQINIQSDTCLIPSLTSHGWENLDQSAQLWPACSCQPCSCSLLSPALLSPGVVLGSELGTFSEGFFLRIFFLIAWEGTWLSPKVVLGSELGTFSEELFPRNFIRGTFSEELF